MTGSAPYQSHLVEVDTYKWYPKIDMEPINRSNPGHSRGWKQARFQAHLPIFQRHDPGVLRGADGVVIPGDTVHSVLAKLLNAVPPGSCSSARDKSSKRKGTIPSPLHGFSHADHRRDGCAISFKHLPHRDCFVSLTLSWLHVLH